MSETNENKITVVILGDGGAGKSCVTMRLLRSKWIDEYDPTIEDSYSTQRQIDGTDYRLDIIDTAGQEEYRDMLGSLFSSESNIDAYLMVYDITSQTSLENLEYFDGLIEKNLELTTNKPVKMVAGNKCDLEDQRQVPRPKGLAWARNHNCGFMETSAKNMVNIEEIFQSIVRQVVLARLPKNGSVGTESTLAGTTASANEPQHQASRANLRQAFSSANLRSKEKSTSSNKRGCCVLM